MNILDLTGKTALITGAGQGVGFQAAVHLAAHGANVVINDFNEEKAAAAAKEICAEFGDNKAMGICADVTDFDAVMAMAEAAREAYQSIDILVNNAGNAGADFSRLSPEPFWKQSPENWAPWLNVNLMGVMNCSRACLPDMIEKKQGSIINVISDAGRVGEANMEAYSAAKAGTAGFTRSVARTVGKYTVRANCVAISGTRTPTTVGFMDNEDFAKKALSKYVIRRFGEPSDVANMILFLASDATSWVTGQTYPVNGGFDFAQ